MARGYTGKMLWVDLTTREIKEEALDEEMCRKYIGGYGLGAKILFDRQKGGVDPLGPEAIFGVVTGPYTGTSALGASRYVIVGKSPLTGGWGDANSGGDFGPVLKWAGYDALFFTGIAEKPTYLFIDNGKAELRDAAELWGKDTFDTEDELIRIHSKGTESISIGPSGEKLSRIAAVMNNKGRAAGRSGLGAVMGSKKLKAVAVKGDLPVPQFDEEGVKALRKKAMKEMTGHTELLKDLGTAGIFNFMCEMGDTPTRNWGASAPVHFPQYKNIGGDFVRPKMDKKYACYKCPLRCGGHMKEITGEYEYAAGAHKPEYESLGMFGTNCMIDNLDAVTIANDVCNRYGLDTISVGSIMGFTMECYENGIITKEDTDGIEMTWGNHQAMVAMTEKLAKREGFGDILADGVKIAAEKIGKGADQYAFHVLGQEVPAHNPKFGLQWAISYVYDATPARHTQGGGPCPPGIIPEFNPRMVDGRGPLHSRLTNWFHALSAVGACHFVGGGYSHADVLTDFLKLLTGWDYTTDEVIEAGERIANIRQAFNIREGINSAEWKMPGRLAGNPPDEEGPLAGITLDYDKLKKEYFDAMGWDLKTARPTNETLNRLGMEEVATAI